jgi:hypothetical protein
MANFNRRRYVRHSDKSVIAVCLALDTDGLVYRKWGSEQHAKTGDWIVDNDGEIYTVDAEVFARTYHKTGPGTYVKTTPIWAEQATHAGSIKTKEGLTHYEAGDYLVSNNSDGTDEYAIGPAKFKSLYTPDDEDS